jgi:hypothetical protein
MKLHANAALSWSGRRRLCELVSIRVGRSRRLLRRQVSVFVRKWVCRYLVQALAGLVDRSSAPGRVANRADEDRVEAIVWLAALAVYGGRDRRDALYRATGSASTGS